MWHEMVSRLLVPLFSSAIGSCGRTMRTYKGEAFSYGNALAEGDILSIPERPELYDPIQRNDLQHRHPGL
jgi:hypothetical protein